MARCSALDSLLLARGPVSSSTPAISTAASSSNGSGLTGRMSSGSAPPCARPFSSSRGWRCAVHPRCNPCYTATGGQLVHVSVVMRHHKHVYDRSDTAIAHDATTPPQSPIRAHDRVRVVRRRAAHRHLDSSRYGHEKVELLPSVQKLQAMGYNICMTSGTSDFLSEHGVSCKYVETLGDGSSKVKSEYSLIQHLANDLIDMYINLPSKDIYHQPASYASKGYCTRRMAVDFALRIYFPIPICSRSPLTQDAHSRSRDLRPHHHYHHHHQEQQQNGLEATPRTPKMVQNPATVTACNPNADHPPASNIPDSPAANSSTSQDTNTHKPKSLASPTSLSPAAPSKATPLPTPLKSPPTRTPTPPPPT
ncbi:hypothetical protein BC826DRAFT_1113486 [Russula brevipes]|nr:hypothetical protein BC826DRAFT_1113486 [Russula brevipes]